MKIFLVSLWVILGVHQSWAAATDPSRTNYKQIQEKLRLLAEQYPAQVKGFNIGVSDHGETIDGVAIGKGPVRNLVVATHHGNEYGSTEVALAVANALAKAPLSGQTIYVIPVLNVGGYNVKNREEISKNGSSHDPNRDYPGPCGSEGPHALKSTAALARWVDQQGIVTSSTLHTFTPAVVYPWGLGTQDLSTPYDSLFKNLTQIAASESHYETGNSSEVIYPANGTFEDYAFWKHGIWSILFELGYTHNPTPAQIDTMIKVNVPGILKMFAAAPTSRAEHHDFTGTCDGRLLLRDRHDE